jgi:hypothetical protein
MRYLISGSLLLAAIIHLLPLAGVLGHDRLATLYGINAADPNLSILLRHRAVLFGLLGAFLVVAAFRPGWQAAAFVAGLVSVVSFLLLAWSTGGYNALIGRVVTADLVALVALLAGAVAWWRTAG